MKVSIVICTYNRAALLQDCLRSLIDQTAPYPDYEILVVDNNSSDNTREICDSLSSDLPNLRYSFEPRQGLSHARNHGFRAARADWVAYLDDDALAYSNYVERIIYTIENYNFDCFGGVYLPWYKYGKPKWFLDEYGSKACSLQKVGILEKGYAAGGVIVFRKSVLERFNGFSPDIGMSGTQVGYGEEVQIQVKIREAGLTIGMDPELKIQHLVDLYKQNVLWFIKSAYANGRDDWATFDRRITWPALARIVGRGMVDLLVAMVSATRRLTAPDYFMQNWIIDVGGPLSRRTGRLVSGVKLKLAGAQSPARSVHGEP